MTSAKCPHLSTAPGLALVSSIRGGEPDFPGDTESSTYYVSGPGKVVRVIKCRDCGASWSAGAMGAAQAAPQCS